MPQDGLVIYNSLKTNLPCTPICHLQIFITNVITGSTILHITHSDAQLFANLRINGMS